MKPIIKWVGGKRQLLPRIKEMLPRDYNNYFEPFVGGGALLFELAPDTTEKKVTIADLNPQLINMYKQIRDNCGDVINLLNEYDSEKTTSDIYYRLRSKYNQLIVEDVHNAESAALLIWLNKHCFNWLYRVNAAGLFNVPFNGKEEVNYDFENIRDVSRYLADVEILLSDFESTVSDAEAGDFVYLDPPYVPETKTANFTAYTKNGFIDDEHLRIAKCAEFLADSGVYVMVSNNDVPLVHELYKEFAIISVSANRNINRDGNKRKGREVLITNYQYTTSS